MDCNKEEAMRVVAMAEKKMQMKDFVGAKRLALKAQQLFPGLENILHLLTVCEVHCSAATSINGSEDWYSILQVEVTADVLSIKKQYRKLALLLHPDKNKFAGAESAFKLIGEAHRTLTDQAKRSFYDLKRRPVLPKIQTQPKYQNRNSFVNMPSGFNFSNPGNDRTGPFQQPPQKQTSATISPTFWTICPFCGMKYQYYRSILDRTIRCQNCLRTFNAYDVDVQRATTKEQQSSSHQVNNGVHNMKFQGNTSGKSTVMDSGSKAGGEVGGSSRPKPKEGTQVDDTVKENKVKFENVSKFSNKREAASEYPGKQKRKKRKNTVLSDTESSDNEEVFVVNECCKSSDGMVNEPRRSTRQKQNVIYNEDGTDEEAESNDIGAVSPLKRLRKGGSSCHSENAVPSESGVDKGKIHVNQSTTVKAEENVTHDETSAKNINKTGNHKGDSRAQERDAGRKDASDNVINADSDASEKDNTIFSYPDPEFFDFQGSRDASIFATDQVWAIYDDSDGMPRFYARIRNVVDKQNFKVRFTWLEHEPSGVEVDWSLNDLPVACGNFTLGKTQTSVDLPMFSHRMAWESESRRNTYTINPRTGEIWALFKDWDIKWIQDPEKQRSYEYEIVEILSDYKHDSGTLVARMIKVKGFVSLYARSANEKTGVFQIRHDEMLRFSHMIPCHKMTGEEREGVPGGSYELDTASLPPNFDVLFPSANYDHISANEEQNKQTRNIRSSSYDVDNQVESKSKRENHRTCEDVSLNRASKDSVRDGGRSEASCAAVGSGMHPNKEEAKNGTTAVSLDTAPFDYPDTEFHSFESERSFDKFQPGQIWALYSDIDGFPKYYAMVTEVDVEASRVHIAWLEICPDHTEEIQWFNKDLPFGCGRYKLLHGKKNWEMYEGLETFSHQMQTEASGKKSMYFIYPRVGEIWAIYRNWNAEWEVFDSDKCEYDVVEIKCRTQHAVEVIPLEKVEGHHVVFKHISKNESEMMVILRSEWLRFSHQIPSFLLTEERGGKLRGYWELDPASVPETLLCDS